MAYASVTYDGSQGTGPYPVPFHTPQAAGDSSELVVTVGGVQKFYPDDWTIDSPNLNLTLTVSAGGSEVIIARETSLDEDDFPVTFTNGAPITKQNLDDAFHHLLHQNQEQQDDIDAIPDGPPGPPGPPGADGEPGIVWMGTWSSLTTYAPGDAVEFSGASYIALTTTLNDQPDISPSDWDLLAAEGAAGPAGADGVGDEAMIFMGL